MSGKRGDPTDKYFHFIHITTAGKFADHQLGYRERKQALSNLIQTYLATFSDIGVETWLMHGTLLGWWWNRKILPWDSDSDVQVTEASMHYLASYYNMSVFHYKTPRIPEGRDYMLEINPHYVNREQSDKLNVIDARWVDTTSGLFIDITTARYNLTHPAGAGMLSCKDGHEYRDSYIFPLRDTFFEGTPAKIPFAYKAVLEAEYHQKALTLTEFEGHHFDDQKYEWIPVPEKVELEKEEQKQEEPKKEEAMKEEVKEEEKKAEPAQQSAPPAQEQHEIIEDTKPSDSQPETNKDYSTPSVTKKLAESSLEKAEVSKRAEPQQPSVQRQAEENMGNKEMKREELMKKMEEKRKSLEGQAIVKEEKRAAIESKQA
ncbi:LicD family-domain-containing protein [Rhexocercosporidium sp. MPI-PUGE-AT-0058]|nr:LicD family-domain-containing protein [Rhexocercosporidium sp. MPI-PUGE-AT-0058]